MLFRSREKPSLTERLRLAVWPRRSWSRSARYYRERIVRLSGSPHAVALGFASGVGVAFTPFFGIHVIMGVALAFVLRANLIAAALGTAVANPVTVPLIWAATYKLGSVIIGQPPVHDHSHMHEGLALRSLDLLWPVLKPMLAGALPLGLLAATIAYFLVFSAVRAFRAVRRSRTAGPEPRNATPEGT
mgnify:CR=1 FL=1